MEKKYWAHAAIAGANLIYSFNFSIAKSVMPLFIGPQALSILRVVGATVLFWLVGLLQPWEKISRADIPRLFVASLMGVSVNQNLFLTGLNMTSSIDASIIVTTNPIVVLLTTAIFFNTPITTRKFVGIVLGIVGAVLVILNSGKGELGFNAEKYVGNFLVFINAVTYSFYLIMIKKLSDKYSPLTMVRWLFTLGVAPVILIGWHDFGLVQWDSLHTNAWAALGFVVVAATFGTYLLNVYGIKYAGPTLVSTYINAQPVIASIIAVVWGIGRPGVFQFISALLVIFGVFLVSSSRGSFRKFIHRSLVLPQNKEKN